MEKECADAWSGQQLYLETGRTSSEWTPTRLSFSSSYHNLAIFTWFDQDDKQLVITDGEAVLSKPLLLDMVLLAPCSHEEADSRMLLHVSHAANHGHHKILIKTVDTDVLVLAVSVTQGLLPEDELWLAFGTGVTV